MNGLIDSIITTLSSLLVQPEWIDITDQLDQR